MMFYNDFVITGHSFVINNFFMNIFSPPDG